MLKLSHRLHEEGEMWQQVFESADQAIDDLLLSWTKC